MLLAYVPLALFMHFTGEHAYRQSASKVVVTFDDRIVREGLRIRQTKTRARRLERIAVLETKDRLMQLLENEPRYGEGRGRAAVDSTFEVANVISALGAETLPEAVTAAIGLGSPFLAAIKDEDWTGTLTGAKSILTDLVNEIEETDGNGETVNPFRVAYRAASNGERKTVIKFTFRRSLD